MFVMPQYAHPSGYQIRGEKIGSILVDDPDGTLNKIDSCHGGIVSDESDPGPRWYLQKGINHKTVKKPMTDNGNPVLCIAVSLHKIVKKSLGPILTLSCGFKGAIPPPFFTLLIR